MNFKAASKAPGDMKINPKASPNQKSRRWDHENSRLLWKLCFCDVILSRHYLFLEMQTSKFRPKTRKRKRPGNKHEQKNLFSVRCNKSLLKMGTQNLPQIETKRSLRPKCPECPKIPRDAIVEVASTPDAKFAHPKRKCLSAKKEII